MAPEEDSHCMDLQRRVLQYVLNLPAARDTVEGIALWWLRGEEHMPYAALRQVLSGLVAKGWLIARPVARGIEEPENMYGLNAAEVAAIRGYLAAPAPAAIESDPAESGSGLSHSHPDRTANKRGCDG
jgi:hypothetical protein